MFQAKFSVIEHLLAEDVPNGDLTTDSLEIGAIPGRIRFQARAKMVVAGLEVAADMMRSCGIAVEMRTASGARIEAGALLLEGTGSAAALHKAWKASQTLVEILSGIASATRALVDAVEAENPKIRVATTRKTFPGARKLSQQAVKAGGGIIHRTGLSETVLVFTEHRAFLEDASFTQLAQRLRHAAPEKKLVIEVLSVAEAQDAIAAGFDVIQLEKFEPAAVAEVVALTTALSPPPLIAMAGGMNPKNVADFVRAGAGLIISSWPYTAPPADVKVVIERV